MIFYQLSRAIGNAVIAIAMWTLGDNLALCGTICVVVLFFMEMTKTVPTTAGHDMNIRIGDYQMYLSGERLESFAGIFGWFTGPITSFVGLIIPIFLLRYGFNSNWDVLYIDSARFKIIAVPLIIDIIGFVLMTIPYFFWDYDNYYTSQQSQEAGRFLRENLKLFPPTDEITHNNFLDINKQMKSIAAVSNALQCKYVNTLLREISDKLEFDKRTAIVLTDESLLMPLLHALPAELKDNINVTMGYPLRQTTAYSLVERLIELQKNARNTNFYHADVVGVLGCNLRKISPSGSRRERQF